MKKLTLALTFVAFFAVSTWAQIAIVSADKTKLYGTPSEQGKSVDKLPQSTKVRIITQEGEWSLVQSSDYVGWVRTGSLLVIPPPPSARASTTKPPVPVSAEVSVSASNQESATITGQSQETNSQTGDQRSAVAGVQTGVCKDGTPTYSETKQSACADHGGVDSWFAESSEANRSAPTTTPGYTPSSGGPVQVKGYYRKDGTYVRPHTRSAPRKR